MGKTYTNRKDMKHNQRQSRHERRNAKRAWVMDRKDGTR